LIASTDKLSEKIIEAHKVQEVDTKNLSKKEKTIFENFLNTQKRENRIINISKEVSFSKEDNSKEENTKGIYYENGEYFIKYTDLNFKRKQTDYSARICLNHQCNGLLKSLFPVLYEDTHDNPKYTYLFKGKYNIEGDIKYYYKSIYDESGLIITYTTDKRKITDINLKYQDIFYNPNRNANNENSNNSNLAFQIIVSITIAGVLALVIIKIMGKFKV